MRTSTKVALLNILFATLIWSFFAQQIYSLGMLLQSEGLLQFDWHFITWSYRYTGESLGWVQIGTDLSFFFLTLLVVLNVSVIFLLQRTAGLCPQCGSSVVRKAKFCSNCGKPLQT